MAQQNPIPVEEGDKIEIGGEDDVHVVTWTGLSVKADPAGGNHSLSDRKRFDDDEFVEKVQNGTITVLSGGESVTPAALELREHVDVQELADRLEGRNGGLRVSKPDTDADDGLTQAVWRYARFCSGADTSMPVTCHWWLQDYLDEHGIGASVSGILDEAGQEIHNELFDVVDAVLAELGVATGQAAQRWKGLAY